MFGMTNQGRNDSSAGPGEVKSVKTLFSILEQLSSNGPMGVTELSKALGMSKGGVHRYLQTLVNEGYAVKEEGTYNLGLRFLTLGGTVRQHFPYNAVIEQSVRKIARETGQRAQFLSEEHGYGIYLYRERDPQTAPLAAAIGRLVHLHTTAAGKAILANLSEDHIEEIIQKRGLRANTEKTITDRDTLLNALGEVREQGFAVNEGEHLEGVYAIGVPIRDPSGEILGGLSISGPSQKIQRLSKDGELPRELISFAEEIELEIKYS